MQVQSMQVQSMNVIPVPKATDASDRKKWRLQARESKPTTLEKYNRSSLKPQNTPMLQPTHL